MDSDNSARILVVDDEESMREVLSVLLGKAGYRVQTAASGREALRLLEQEPFDLLISDIRMPDLDGLELLAQAKARDSGLNVIMMTAFGTEDTAVEAMRRGADDYFSKPVKASSLTVRVERALEGRRLRQKVRALQQELERGGPRFEGLVGASEPMRQIFERIDKIASYKSPVLVVGESGTGKELVAKALHARSGRRGPFIPLNCGAVPPTLVESELFGHEKGAFTGAERQKRGLFEEAHGGTLFLDEIGEIPEDFQVKLLRALQEEEIRRVGGTELIPLDVRVIAATEQKLEALIEQGRFRRSLYYRLNVVTLELPPLRQRKSDIALLSEHFLAELARRSGTPAKRLGAAALAALEEQSWPGNVRELENTLERAAILSSGELIQPRDLPFESAGDGGVRVQIPQGRLALKPTLKEVAALVERELIRRALQETGGNRTRAAQLLGISHRALLYKLQDYGEP
jgi:two-component system, NtrC family, response regulator AtoC